MVEFTPARTSAGIVDLGDPATKLYYVNRAHRTLVTNSTRDGWLSISSTGGILWRQLSDLTEAQVDEINNVLFRLGLRKSKPGGGDSVIRTDIWTITMEQLVANEELPAATFFADLEADAAEELANAVLFTAEGLKEAAELIVGSACGLAIVRDHMGVIEGFANELAGEVILALKKLDLYRVYTFGNNMLCFIQSAMIDELTLEIVMQKRAWFEWPDTIEELLPPKYLVKMMPLEQIVEILIGECERLEEECLRERRARIQDQQALSTLQEQLAVLMDTFETLEQKHAASKAQVEASEERIAQLEAELAAAKTRPTTTLSSDLQDRFARILDRNSDGA